MAKLIGFSIFCLGLPNFKIFRGPLGPGGPWVNASLQKMDIGLIGPTQSSILDSLLQGITTNLEHLKTEGE